MRKLNRVLLVFGLGLVLSGVNLAGEGENATGRKEKRAQSPVQIKVTAWGRTQAEIDAARVRVERSGEVQKYLSGTRFRLLEFNYVENEDKSKPRQIPARFQAVFYDYTNDRTLVAESDFDAKTSVTVTQAFYQPLPDDEEFNEAVRAVQQDERFASMLRGGAVTAFRPMPPTTVLSGTTERIVNVGLDSSGDAARNEVVGVGIKSGRVVRYEKGAPDTSLATPDACGVPTASQPTTGRGVAGQYNLTVSQNGTTLWEMLITRPSASSGTRASGIEVADVKYKGKSVLKRGNAPVLNVLYTGNQCGPYRDWQFQEDMFQAPDAGAIDPVAGIRILAPGQIATTVLETGNDTGNFRGVAVYTQNNEVVMVSELQAGWYRYIMEWRFANDGTIRPRFGFGATNDSCVCYVHNHHVYWRFDFDVATPNNKVFQVERGRKFLQPVTTEMTRLRNYQTNRSLLVQNSTGDEAYMLVPSVLDGIADNYGRSDLWVLRYKNVNGGTPLQNEIDDGFSFTGGACTTNGGSCINIDKFIDGESVVNQDVVVWYGAHFIHADGANLLDPNRNPTILSNSHVVGPDIRPVRW